jgi:hypothetical protein
LGEIRFAADLPASDGASREGVEANIRDFLHRVGVGVGQDIIDMGCTGIVQGLYNLLAKEDESRYSPEECRGRALNTASVIRRNMAGSVCGLPCYVPRDRYCLVHDTIGGLQLTGNFDGPQAQRHPEALPFMSRELTEDERRKVAGIEAKLSADAKAAALAEYGATDLDGEPVVDTSVEEVATAPSCPIPQPPFKCPDHTEPDWDCRKCIAQAIVEGKKPLHQEYWVDDNHVGWESIAAINCGLAKLTAGECTTVELWVHVASWSKKVTRD